MHREVLDARWARKPGEARQAMERLLGATETNIRRGLSQARATSS